MIHTDVVIEQAHQRTRFRYFELIVLMGILQAFAPLSIDMYLPSMPLLEKVFNATTAQVQVTLVTFLLGFALGQSIYGPLTDRFGRKPPLYVSLALFVVSSVACALSTSVNALSVFRLLQAIGACGGAVVSRAMVRDLFPPVELRKIFSMLVLVLGVSPLVAPFIGGYLLVWFGWKSIFYTQASLGAVTLLAMHFRLAESLARENARPLHMAHVISSYTHLLRDRTFLGASLVCGFSSAGMFAYIASAPFVFINLYKLPPQRFGWLFGFIAAGLIAASQVNGRMSHNIPLWRVLRVANLVQLGSGFAVLLTAATGFGGLAGIFAPVFVYMCAPGFVFPNGNAIAMMRHGNMAGTASALLGTNQFVIAAATTIVLGLIDNSSAMPMAIVIAGCGVAATALNYWTLGSKLERGSAGAGWDSELRPRDAADSRISYSFLWNDVNPSSKWIRDAGNERWSAILVVARIANMLHIARDGDSAPEVCSVISFEDVFGTVPQSPVAEDEAESAESEVIGMLLADSIDDKSGADLVVRSFPQLAAEVRAEFAGVVDLRVGIRFRRAVVPSEPAEDSQSGG